MGSMRPKINVRIFCEMVVRIFVPSSFTAKGNISRTGPKSIFNDGRHLE